MPFFVIFVIVPLLEILVFASVSEHIGIFTTLLIAFLTAIIGGTIVKHQGLQTILAMRIAMDRGKLPLGEIFDGFCLVAAGATLITPGFITDTIGFLLLMPPVRHILKTMIKNHTSWFVSHREFGDFQSRSKNVIEGEYEKIDDDKT